MALQNYLPQKSRETDVDEEITIKPEELNQRDIVHGLSTCPLKKNSDKSLGKTNFVLKAQEKLNDQKEVFKNGRHPLFFCNLQRSTQFFSYWFVKIISRTWKNWDNIVCKI